MPANPERRTQILDAAIGIFCDDGVGGLTHRQVDSRADVPAGTTSNYFRTRQALLEATAARTVDLHWQRVEALQSAVGPLTRDALMALITGCWNPMNSSAAGPWHGSSCSSRALGAKSFGR